MLTVIECFGTKRCMFGTHWPYDTLFSSYRRLIGAYAEILAGFSLDERRDLLFHNALRLYRIETWGGPPASTVTIVPHCPASA